MLDVISQAAVPSLLLDEHQCHKDALIILTTADGELKATSSASEFSVHLGVGVESVVNTTSLLLVQDNLQHLASVLLGS